MTKKTFIITILILIALNSCCSQNIEKTVSIYSIEKLHGEWLYVNNYDGILTKIDTLKKEPKKYKYAGPTLTYEKDGTYINYQGDYSDNGTYIFDSKNGLMKEFYSMGSTKVTSTSRITYLDDFYMLLVVQEDDKESTRTFFYKKR